MAHEGSRWSRRGREEAEKRQKRPKFIEKIVLGNERRRANKTNQDTKRIQVEE